MESNTGQINKLTVPAENGLQQVRCGGCGVAKAEGRKACGRGRLVLEVEESG